MKVYNYKEINGGIPQERRSRGDCENLLNELLLHVDLLFKTVQFLREIGNISSLDQQDKVKRSLYASIIIVISLNVP